jgi:hypothetical protein
MLLDEGDHNGRLLTSTDKSGTMVLPRLTLLDRGSGDGTWYRQTTRDGSNADPPDADSTRTAD